METALRAALLAWLRTDRALADSLNLVTEEAPPRAHYPWLGIVASASIDWSVKERKGREIRIALEIHCRGEEPTASALLAAAIESRIETLPQNQPGFDVASIVFLRSRVEQRAGNLRAMLIEYRFRLLAA